MKLNKIQKWFVESRGLHIYIAKVTITTWYNEKNTNKFSIFGDFYAKNNDTCIIPKKRPRIYFDIEAVMKI